MLTGEALKEQNSVMISGGGTHIVRALRTDLVAEFRIGMIGDIFFDGQPGSVLVFDFFAVGADGQEGSHGIDKVFFNRRPQVRRDRGK